MLNISLQEPRLFKQFAYTRRNIGKFVRLLTPRYEHSVEPIFDVRHNGGYRRFHLAPNTVALYSFAEFFTDGEPNLALFVVACAVEQYQIPIGDARRVLVYVVVLVVFLKSVYRLQGYDLLCGQLMTTLVSASGKRSSATGGLHSCAETVHFASLSFLGLIRSFHVFRLLFGNSLTLREGNVLFTSPVRQVDLAARFIANQTFCLFATYRNARIIPIII